MPIYAYRCATCGHAKDVLQKMSDPVLTECPACHAPTFVKQLTAAGFQLKGSGWYVTDFRGDSSAKPAVNGDAAKPANGETTPGDATKTEAAPSVPATKSDTAAAAPAPPAATPATGAK